MYITQLVCFGIAIGAVSTALRLYLERGLPMFTMTITGAHGATRVVNRPLCVDTRQEAEILAEEATKRFLSEDKIVLVHDADDIYQAVKVEKTGALVHITEI